MEIDSPSTTPSPPTWTLPTTKLTSAAIANASTSCITISDDEETGIPNTGPRLPPPTLIQSCITISDEEDQVAGQEGDGRPKRDTSISATTTTTVSVESVSDTTPLHVTSGEYSEGLAMSENNTTATVTIGDSKSQINSQSHDPLSHDPQSRDPQSVDTTQPPVSAQLVDNKGTMEASHVTSVQQSRDTVLDELSDTIPDRQLTNHASLSLVTMTTEQGESEIGPTLAVESSTVNGTESWNSNQTVHDKERSPHASTEQDFIPPDVVALTTVTDVNTLTKSLKAQSSSTISDLTPSVVQSHLDKPDTTHNDVTSAKLTSPSQELGGDHRSFVLPDIEIEPLPYKFLCPYCQEGFCIKDDLITHTEVSHGVRGDTGGGEHQTDHNNVDIKEEVDVDAENRVSHICQTCNRCFQSLPHFCLHLMDHDPQGVGDSSRKKYSCDMCKTYYIGKQDLFNHRHGFHRPNMKPVPLRSATQRTRKGPALGHRKIKGRRLTKKTFPCTECSWVFTTKSGLKEHYKHRACGKTSRQYRVQHRISANRGVKAYGVHAPCTRYPGLLGVCDCKYLCMQCKRHFRFREDLVDHQKTPCRSSPSQTHHTPPSPSATSTCFPCPKCGRSYKNTFQMLRHKRDHQHLNRGFSTQKGYHCQMCSTYYDLSKNMENHMRRCHKSATADVTSKENDVTLQKTDVKLEIQPNLVDTAPQHTDEIIVDVTHDNLRHGSSDVNPKDVTYQLTEATKSQTDVTTSDDVTEALAVSKTR